MLTASYFWAVAGHIRKVRVMCEVSPHEGWVIFVDCKMHKVKKNPGFSSVVDLYENKMHITAKMHSEAEYEVIQGWWYHDSSEPVHVGKLAAKRAQLWSHLWELAGRQAI